MFRSTMKVTYRLWFVLLSIACTASTTDQAPAVDCETLRIFYVVSHGWHTGVVVDRRDIIMARPSLAQDFSDGQYLEMGWGDEQFYQARTITPNLALRAVLWPTNTVLHVVEVPTAPQRYFSRSEVLEISVPEAGYERLLTFIAASFEEGYDNRVIRLGPGLYGNGWFYRGVGVFHTFNTCNTWVAKAIVSTGFTLTNPAPITVEGLLSQLRRGVDGDLCYGIR